MKSRAVANPERRQPSQQRSRRTVEAVLDAVARVLKREGAEGVTTNRIAEAAGVSIGSVYQYFPNKQAIFLALHERHLDEMGRLVESRLVEQAAESLDDLMGGLIDAMIEAHALDPQLHELLLAQVPHGTKGDRLFETRIRGALRLALSSRSHEFTGPLRMERMLFVLTQMVEALAHGSVLRRPPGLSLAAAKQESAVALLAYLHAHGRRVPRRQGSVLGRKRRTRG